MHQACIILAVHGFEASVAQAPALTARVPLISPFRAPVPFSSCARSTVLLARVERWRAGRTGWSAALEDGVRLEQRRSARRPPSRGACNRALPEE